MNKITLQEHKIIGMIAKILNCKLLKEGCDICNAEKTKKKGMLKSLHYFKAENYLSNFKNHMEEIMFKDYPQATTNIYYGDRPKDGDIIKKIKEMLEDGIKCW